MADPTLDLASATPVERFVVGDEVVAIGPAEGSKLGPPARATVLEVLDDRYRVSGKGRMSPFILFAAQDMWRRA